MPIVTRIKLVPEEREILRLLGRGPGNAVSRATTVALVREALEEAEELGDPCGVYEFRDRATVPPLAVFQSAERVGFCVCTLGPRLEGRVRDLMAGGELARGVVLDAVGSEAAEAAARVMDERLADEGVREGLTAGGRFSPGYGGWELESQRFIFDILEPERIGVRLTQSLMMTPRKSVSFAVNFGPDPEPPRCADSCHWCELADCPYRREGQRRATDQDPPRGDG